MDNGPQRRPPTVAAMPLLREGMLPLPCRPAAFWQAGDGAQNARQGHRHRRRRPQSGRSPEVLPVALVTAGSPAAAAKAARAAAAAAAAGGAGGGPVWAENFVSGAAASLLSKLILQPFDTTKTVLQAAAPAGGGYAHLGDALVGLARAAPGGGALYRGLAASVVVSAPSSAVFFTAYEAVKRGAERLAEQHPSAAALGPLAPLLGAALGNVVSSVVRVPPEVVKQRVQTGMYRDMLHAAGTMWAQEGLPGFYTGYSTMVARDIPYAAIQFTAFEALKKRRLRRLRRAGSGTGGDYNASGGLSRRAHLLGNLWMGAVSGALAAVLTSPIDVVKTRVMTQPGPATAAAFAATAATTASGTVRLGMRQTFARIWAEEGIAAFGRGLAPRLLYKVPASAVFLVCYEGMKRLLRSARLSREATAGRRHQPQPVLATSGTAAAAPS
eukprot:SM000027S09682  [mRNA]  locus=s27:769067:771713:+ [translate_table: standard]